MAILIGIDGGGTRCRAIVSDMQGKHLGFGLSGAANIMTDFDRAGDNIIDASYNALADAKLPKDEIFNASVCLGLAGANVGDYAKRMIAQLPFKQCHIDSDGVLSLIGAIGDRDGAVAIIGTGSVYVYRRKGVIHSVGGWGFTIGDLASGARLGRSILQEALLCHDHIHDGSPLIEHILQRFDNKPQRLVEFAQSAKPGDFATLAPLLFEYLDKGDAVARRIIDCAVNEIEKTLNVILDDDNQYFCMLGGLGKKYTPLLNDRFSHQLRQPVGDGASGAILLAVERFSPTTEKTNG